MKKSYNNYYFTIRSSLYSPFNSMKLHIHFQHELTNNSVDGYYLLNSFEQYPIIEFYNGKFTNYESNFPNMQKSDTSCIKKISSA